MSTKVRKVMLSLRDEVFLASLPPKTRAAVDKIDSEGGGWTAVAKQLEQSRAMRDREVGRLIQLRLDARQLRCPTCQSLPILYRKSRTVACPNCSHASLPLGDALLLKAFPELVSE